MRIQLSIVFAVVSGFMALVIGVTRTTAQTTCTRDDFAEVVDQAAAALRSLNARNKPLFQTKLRKLKDVRRWDHATFLKNAEPFVRDPKIAAYDARAHDLLLRINALGEQGGAAATADCNLLDELRTSMKAMVNTQSEKWRYMFEKLRKALSE